MSLVGSTHPEGRWFPWLPFGKDVVRHLLAWWLVTSRARTLRLLHISCIFLLSGDLCCFSTGSWRVQQLYTFHCREICMLMSPEFPREDKCWWMFWDFLYCSFLAFGQLADSLAVDTWRICVTCCTSPLCAWRGCEARNGRYQKGWQWEMVAS